MTHARPLPDAATPPYPAHPAPHDHADTGSAATATEETKASEPAKTPEPARENRLSAGAKVGIGAAAVGIGSAAIAAALLYANRDRKPSAKR